LSTKNQRTGKKKKPNHAKTPPTTNPKKRERMPHGWAASTTKNRYMSRQFMRGGLKKRSSCKKKYGKGGVGPASFT